jgi:hypothetical protein
MSFKTLKDTIDTVTAACIAHAEKNAWDLHSKDNLGFYTWKKEVWWPRMKEFITTYKYNEKEIESWGLFDRMEAGLTYDMYLTSKLPYVQALRRLKVYLANYIGEQRLFRA